MHVEITERTLLLRPESEDEHALLHEWQARGVSGCQMRGNPLPFEVDLLLTNRACAPLLPDYLDPSRSDAFDAHAQMMLVRVPQTNPTWDKHSVLRHQRIDGMRRTVRLLPAEIAAQQATLATERDPLRRATLLASVVFDQARLVELQRDLQIACGAAQPVDQAAKGGSV